MENPFKNILKNLISIAKAIEKLKTTSNDDEDFMTLEQVSLFIGLAKPSVYGLVHKRQIQHFKASKPLYFKKSDVVKWITSGKVNTKQEINRMADEYIYRNPLI